MWPLACKPVATKPAKCVNPPLECQSRASQVRVFYCPKSGARIDGMILKVWSASTHVQRTGVDLILIAGPACCKSAKAQEAPWPHHLQRHVQIPTPARA